MLRQDGKKLRKTPDKCSEEVEGVITGWSATGSSHQSLCRLQARSREKQLMAEKETPAMVTELKNNKRWLKPDPSKVEEKPTAPKLIIHHYNENWHPK